MRVVGIIAVVSENEDMPGRHVPGAGVTGRRSDIGFLQRQIIDVDLTIGDMHHIAGQADNPLDIRLVNIRDRWVEYDNILAGGRAE